MGRPQTNHHQRSGNAVAEGNRGPRAALEIQSAKSPLGGGDREAADGDTVGVAKYARDRSRNTGVGSGTTGRVGGPAKAPDRPGPAKSLGRGQTQLSATSGSGSMACHRRWGKSLW